MFDFFIAMSGLFVAYFWCVVFQVISKIATKVQVFCEKTIEIWKKTGQNGWEIFFKYCAFSLHAMFDFFIAMSGLFVAYFWCVVFSVYFKNS